MMFLIDGHNLIPYIPGIHLADMDDEESLVHVLQIHARVSRSRIEVYFDNAPPGIPRVRKAGTITVHSVAKPAIADTAIIERVRSIKSNPGGWTVVSHDRQVQDSCRKLGAKIKDSQDFANDIQVILRKDQHRQKTDSPLNEQEVEGWLKLFSGGSADPKGKD